MTFDEYANLLISQGAIDARPKPVTTVTGVPGTGTTTANGVPVPTTGQGPYGMVPGATTTANPQQLYNTIYPNLSQDLALATGNNSALLRGELPQNEGSRVWDRRAAQAAAGGVAGSPFTGGNTGSDLEKRRFELQQQGQANLGNLLGTIYQTGVAPSVELSQNNANLAAAPDPQKAAAEQQRVFAAQQANAFQQQQALLLQQFAQQQSMLKTTVKGQSNNPAQGNAQDYGRFWNAGPGQPWF